MGEFITVNPSKKYRTGNPFSALVGTEEEYYSGVVRIEPPCELSSDYLDAISGDVGVSLNHEITTHEASRYRFVVLEGGVWADKPSIESVKHTVRTVLDELGQTNNPNLLRKIYP